MPTSSEFKGVGFLSEDTYGDILKANMVAFVDWNMINRGGFANVSIPSSGIYGGDKHRLRPANDPRYNNGQVWQAFRGNWVWQSGLSTPIQPIHVSGVNVNGTFYPSSTTGIYSHIVDYPRGRIIFNSAIPTSSNVQAEYSYKLVNVQSADEVPFLRVIQYDSNRPDNPMYTQTGSGDWDIMIEERGQLPMIVVSVSEDKTTKGYQLGGGSYVYCNVLFYIFDETNRFHNKFSDALTFQKEKNIFLFDTNLVARANRYPLNSYGSISSGALTYPQMVESSGNGGFRFTDNCAGGILHIKDAEARAGEWLNNKLYYSIVKYQTEVILTNV